MALFSRKKKSTVEKAETKKVSQAHVTDRNLSSVLVHPHVTEKAVMQQGKHVYTFMVSMDATKFMVRDAVIALYKVTPVKVNIVKKLPRQKISRTRGRAVSVKGYKKAYVYLAAGDTINLV